MPFKNPFRNNKSFDSFSQKGWRSVEASPSSLSRVSSNTLLSAAKRRNRASLIRSRRPKTRLVFMIIPAMTIARETIMRRTASPPCHGIVAKDAAYAPMPTNIRLRGLMYITASGEREMRTSSFAIFLPVSSLQLLKRQHDEILHRHADDVAARPAARIGRLREARDLQSFIEDHSSDLEIIGATDINQVAFDDPISDHFGQTFRPAVLHRNDIEQYSLGLGHVSLLYLERWVYLSTCWMLH